ncbi:MAG: lipase maturation factor family protein [Bacteroidetes bacterium]|nr:lipase maturation factor family protein [Bacteroidota bacterium]MBS1973995.1 lipase maturation factor family protein [Bacteroidota bacterium]
MILRLLGIVYAIAFLVAINQVVPLIGEHGLLPVGIFLKRVHDAYGYTISGFVHYPSVFWFFHSDAGLLAIAWTGFVLSLVVLAGFANAPLMAALWFFYMSFVHIGQEWYAYGWEMQLLETGFLAIFLCPLFDMRPFPRRAPPVVIIFLFRWLIFRIMMGAGLIKLRGDISWRNATALYYHFETQPIPGPLSRWFHFLPKIVLKTGVWFNWVAELVAPLFVFWPSICRHVAGTIIVLLQALLILSGNLSFLNWLTIVPALACFDDVFFAKLLPKKLVRLSGKAAANAEPSAVMRIASWTVAFVVAILSAQPVANMISSKQIMNTSFDPLELVNTYGAFGTVGQQRLNVVFEGTMDDNPTDSANWRPYIYKGLPVELNKMPMQIAPYQLRFDWEMWFAAMSSPDEYTWTFNLVWKLLHNDRGAISLFANNPFPGRPPRYVRAVLYHYRFADPGNAKHDWWERERIGGAWMPALSADNPQLIAYIKGQEWLK